MPPFSQPQSNTRGTDQVDHYPGSRHTYAAYNKAVLRRSIEPSQYTSVEFTNRLADWGLAGSYGSVDDCWDNAAMEAFWATLKKEIHHIWGPIEKTTRSELRTIRFDYIDVFYNRSRHQRALDDRTPAETYAAARAA
jgi:transposase InsO family protein